MFQSLSGARLSKIGARQPARAGVRSVAAALVASLLSGIPMQSVRAAVQDAGLQFDGTDDYVSFGQATATLGASTFTLEAWVNRAPGGDLMGTGTHGLGDDGLPQAYPVLTKGCGEGDSSNVDLNYWLGVTDGGAIAADFEDYASGLNHPVVGIGTFPTGEWHHVAATYDGQVWNLYLDGNLDQTLTSARASTLATTASSGLPSGHRCCRLGSLALGPRRARAISRARSMRRGCGARFGRRPRSTTTCRSSSRPAPACSGAGA